MLLSSVSYKIAVSRLLPTVSYLTSLDKYCIASLVMIAAMLGYHAVFGLFIGAVEVHVLRNYDRMFFLFFVCALIVKQLAYVKWLMQIYGLQEELVKNSVFWDQQQKKDKWQRFIRWKF